jgi:tetratricopeptide (TPR) repeat protein
MERERGGELSAGRLCALAVLTFLLYSGTLGAAFHLDDYYTIATNPAFDDMGLFLRPGGAGGPLGGFLDQFRSRVVAYLSFALEYRVFGHWLPAYHALNIAIHAANACLLAVFVSLVLRTPGARGSSLVGGALAPFAAGLLFAVHPVQTEAVTYLTQRIASLCTLWYLLALVLYLAYREDGGRVRRGLAYAGALVAALLAAATKETAATLPLALAAIEWALYPGGGRRFLALLPFALAVLPIPLGKIDPSLPTWTAALDAATRTQETIPRATYALTQLGVILTYGRLLLLPVNQNLDYDYPAIVSIADPRAFAGVGALAAVLAVIAALFLRARRGEGEPAWRLVALGLALALLMALVETSGIALADVIFEHRLYLPSVGLCAGGGVAMALAYRRLAVLPGPVRAGLLAAPLVLFAVLTVHRNQVWRTEVSLWEDTARKSPLKERVLHNLATAYREQGEYEGASRLYRRALALNPRLAQTRADLALALFQAGRAPEAAREYAVLLALSGGAGSRREAAEEAVAYFAGALSLSDSDPRALTDLGMAAAALGEPDLAISYYERALALVPSSPAAAPIEYDIGLAHAARGRHGEAAAAYERALEIAPGMAEAWNNLGNEYFALGRNDDAVGAYERALLTDPSHARARRNLETVLRATPDGRDTLPGR